MYLIKYKLDSGMKLGLELVYGFDVRVAINAFYSLHARQEIVPELFDKLIAKIDLVDAVAFHNALCPSYYITEIYQCSSNAVYTSLTEEK